MSTNILRRTIRKFKDGVLATVEDDLAVEAPLSIVVEGRPFATAMRLPGDDINLAAGLLFNDGVIDAREDIARIDPDPAGSVVRVSLAPGPAERFLRRPSGPQPVLSGTEPFFSSRPKSRHGTIKLDDLLRLKGIFEDHKDIHPQTGATHSSLLFDGNLAMIAYAEDIGRHNALDKTTGAVLLSGRLEDVFLCIMSSRQSYEMVSKAGRLGVEILIGVSTVTSLAVSLAEAIGITLVGFFRKGRLNIYTHPERITER